MKINSVRNIFLGFIVACALLPGIVTATDEAAEKTVIKAVEQWIALIDAGDYAAGWSAASSHFKTAVTRAQWQDLLRPDRPRLGNVISRTVKTVTFAAKIPGMPNGEYVIVRFKTSFQNMKYAVEIVTATIDADRRWRVLGYSMTSPFPDGWSIFMSVLLLVVTAAAWIIELKAAPKPSATD